MNSEHGANQSQWKQWLAALAASSVMLSSSFDTVWATKREHLTHETRIVANACFIVVGAILGAILADIYGRKNTLLAATIFVIPRIVSLNLDSAKFTWITELIKDIGSGITCTVVPLYICEISDTNIRGTLMVFQLSVFTSGAAISQSAYAVFRSYHASQWIGIVGNALLIVSTLFHAIILGIFPETPHYLNWKQRYQEAAQSLAFFRGVHRVKVRGAASEISMNTEFNTDGVCWREKISEIIRFENRRSLAIIISLTAIKWVSGQRRNEFALVLLTAKYFRISGDYLLIGIWTIKLVLNVCVMLTINFVGRKLSLMFVILGSCIATLIFLTPLSNYYWANFASLFIPMISHDIFAAVTLAYLGTFFPINVKAVASALVMSFEVLTRNVIFVIDARLFSLLLLPFCISGLLLFCAFFFVLIFFPKTNNLPYSEIAIEVYENGEGEFGNH